MLKLIRNEYSKIFFKKTTYIVLAVFILLGFGLNLMINIGSSYDIYYEPYSYEDLINDSKYMDKSIYVDVDIEFMQNLIDMGYTSYDDTPQWINSAVSEICYEHYLYYLAITDSKYSADDLMGLNLDNRDAANEMSIYKAGLEAIKNNDYLEFCRIQIDAAEALNKADPEYILPNQIKLYKYSIENQLDPIKNSTLIDYYSEYLNYEEEYLALLDAKNSGESVNNSLIVNAEKYYKLHKYIVETKPENILMESEYNQTPTSSNELITTLTYNTVMCSLAGIFVIIIAAGIFANEFSNGTIKFLLINPVKRAKLFWSKFITCITLLIGTLIVFFILHFVLSIIICGTNGLDGVYLNYVDGQVLETSIISYCLENYVISGISLIPSVTLAFTISSLLRSSALAIALSIIIEFAGSTICLFLSSFGQDWGRYLIFANTDLNGISMGRSIFPAQTLTFAIVTIIVYMVVFLLTAYDSFTKREV